MGIDCSKFQQKEVIIDRLAQEINAAGNISAKAELATQLLQEVETLLSCENYDSENNICRNCHTISNLRKKTASILLKVKEIKEKEE
jgi:hypothetical protein